MTPVVEAPRKPQLPWTQVAWFGALVVACYAPIIFNLARQWSTDDDMGHGFFVPIISGFIVWQRRAELAAIKPRPNMWGLPVVIWGAVQLFLGTLGVELFTTRIALIVTLAGTVLLLGGSHMFRKVAFPIFLLLFMVPIPSVIYNSITFPLQILATKLADNALDLLGVPVLRDGNILTLPNQTLSVVEACSGIRSLLSLTFLSLVYGYFFERKRWIRVVLFLATIPIAIIANGSRVTITGILTQVKPELAEGFFHESTGWVIFMIALAILILFHQAVVRTVNFRNRRTAA
ncbi:MAG TPA: exosortase/archaeosortase family protein [Candidatus Limnocylindrales bacterium]|nr:exosortase/archaeosortase family protein [Candidatus Limnocylindrales bacterium]